MGICEPAVSIGGYTAAVLMMVGVVTIGRVGGCGDEVSLFVKQGEGVTGVRGCEKEQVKSLSTHL